MAHTHHNRGFLNCHVCDEEQRNRERLAAFHRYVDYIRNVQLLAQMSLMNPGYLRLPAPVTVAPSSNNSVNFVNVSTLRDNQSSKDEHQQRNGKSVLTLTELVNLEKFAASSSKTPLHQFRCLLCNAEMSLFEQLINHSRGHINEMWKFKPEEYYFKFLCNFCYGVFFNIGIMKKHINNDCMKNRKEKIDERFTLRCALCNLYESSPGQFKGHVKSKPHVEAIKKEKTATTGPIKLFHCTLCGVHCCDMNQLRLHVETAAHQAKFKIGHFNF